MKRADLGLNLSAKRSLRAEFLAKIERVAPWTEFISFWRQ
jgi:hypothetical protein